MQRFREKLYYFVAQFLIKVAYQYAQTVFLISKQLFYATTTRPQSFAN